MKKIVRLTESDLTRLVKKVIKEQNTEKIISKVEDVLETPKVQNAVENIFSHMSEEDKMEMKELNDELGIDEYSSLEEIHRKLSNYISSFDKMGGEMGEDSSDAEMDKSEAKHKVREMLHDIGAANIAAWGGVPAAIMIGSMTGMPLGFAISWGVSALLMEIARKMGKE